VSASFLDHNDVDVFLIMARISLQKYCLSC